MTFKTLDSGEADIKQEALDGLKLSLSGLMLLPGDHGFEESRTVWNGMIDKHPAVIVKCLGNQDVINCMRFIREHNLLVSIKGGGHHVAGLATADGAFMLDLSLMRGVVVDPVKKIAHAQAGCLLSDVDRETQVHGLASVLGFVSQTGIAGLTLGGGFGYLTRRWGWTSDTVRGMSVVTAEGKLVRADNEQNTDLFWALRGGGGNYGVVTGIEYNLHDAGPMVVGGIVAWHASDAPEVLGYYRKLAEQAPPELTVIALMRLAPPAPWLPKELHGKPIVAILACYSGDTDAGEKIVAPIKAFGMPVGDILVRRPYVQLQTIVDAANPKGRRYYQKSEFLPRVEPALFEKFIHHASMMPSPFSVIMLFQVGGALNHLPGDHSPAGNRDAHFVLNIPGSWEKPEDDEKNISWVRNAWNDLKSFSTGGNYINFQAEDEGKDRLRAAFGDGLQRLIEIKKRWDPENVFRLNRNIKP